MDLGTVIGLAGSVVLTLIAMKLAGNLIMFWDLTSIVIVLGGSALSTLTRWPLAGFISGMSAAGTAIFNKNDDPICCISGSRKW